MVLLTAPVQRAVSSLRYVFLADRIISNSCVKRPRLTHAQHVPDSLRSNTGFQSRTKLNSSGVSRARIRIRSAGGTLPIDTRRRSKVERLPTPRRRFLLYRTPPMRPWTIVNPTQEARPRINCMKHFLSALPYPIQGHLESCIILTSWIAGILSSHVIGSDDHILQDCNLDIRSEDALAG